MPDSAGTDAHVPHSRISSRVLFALWLLAVFCLLGFCLWLPAPAHTRVDLTDAENGRILLTAMLPDGEQLTLTWTNSLFGLPVSEIFVARDGRLIQEQVIFADLGGQAPAAVAARDVEDLYHTGGAFAASGLARPLTRVVFRVGEIGEPRLRVRARVVDFKRAVGFGGRVILTARSPRRYELWFSP